MINSKRNIQQVLNGRKDVSPFFVHLTKRTEAKSAQEILIEILKTNTLKVGSFSGSVYESLAYGTSEYPTKQRIKRRQKYPNHKTKPEVDAPPICLCMTETPLDQIHCLLDIDKRTVNLEPYGVLLLKEKTQRLNGVNPVWYVNNYNNSRFIKKLVETMWRISFEPQPSDSLKDDSTKDYYSGKTLREALCFIEMIGERIGQNLNQGPIDFYWEREWRSLENIHLYWTDENKEKINVFLGLCPNEEINFFEEKIEGLKFIDPYRHPSFYSEKILQRKKELNLEYMIL